MYNRGMTIRRRLAIGFGVMLALLVGMAATLLGSLRGLQQDTRHLADLYTYVGAAHQVESHIDHVLKEVSDLVALNEAEEFDEFAEHVTQVAEAFDRLETLGKERMTRVAVGTDAYQVEQKRKAAADALRRHYESILESSREVIAHAQQGRHAQATHLLRHAIEQEYDAQFVPTMEKLIEAEEREVQRTEAASERRQRFVQIALCCGVGASLLVGLVSALRTTRSITTRIRLLQEATVQVGQGHLETRIALGSDDEVGELARSFDRMIRSLEESTDRLECEIRQRQKAEERQAETLAQLGQVNGELTDFAYVASHDLKAPLRGIKILTEWLCTDYGDRLDDEATESLHLLQSRVARMHNLIDGILQYSRVGRIREDIIEVDLNALLPGIIDGIAPPEHVAIRIEGPLPTIECEKTRITQVFQNLLTNAVKYMDKPAGEIVVACTEDEDTWTFSVSDNGPGIESKHFEQIFKIFQTLAPRDEFESTGVGLTLVKKIVEYYGGRVWVASEVGLGSTFFFTLPKSNAQATEAAAPTAEPGCRAVV
jgi:signal transduction histidine kinase